MEDNSNPTTPARAIAQRSPMEFGQMTQNMTGNPVIDIFLCPERFEMLQRGASLLAASKIVPQHYQGNPGACFIAINIALQLGLEPFAFMQRTYVIGGKLGIEAQVAIAVANKRKVFSEPLDYAFEGDYNGRPPTRACTCTGILSANGKKVSMKLTWGEVEAEGWSKKGGSKWLTIPDQMFKYRTALWLIRTYAPEVLLGLNTADELEDAKIIDITPKKADAEVEDALMGRSDVVVTTVAQTTKEPAKEQKRTRRERPASEVSAPAVAPQAQVETKSEEKVYELKSNEPEIITTETPAESAPSTEATVQAQAVVEVPGKTPFESAVEAEMAQFTGVSYSFGSPFSVENGNAVLKNLQTKAGINDATLPLMTKSVTDGVTDRTQWTADHWNCVRNVMLSVIKRAVEQRVRMALKK